MFGLPWSHLQHKNNNQSFIINFFEGISKSEKSNFTPIQSFKREKRKTIMSDTSPHTITGPELALVLKQKSYSVKYPKWAKCEPSSTQPSGIRTQPLSLQALAGVHIVAHSDGWVTTYLKTDKKEMLHAHSVLHVFLLYDFVYKFTFYRKIVDL